MTALCIRLYLLKGVDLTWRALLKTVLKTIRARKNIRYACAECSSAFADIQY